MPDPAGLLLSNGGRVHIVTFANKRLDVAGARADDFVPVIQWDANDGANQLWVIDPCGTKDHPDEVRIIAGHSGRVLDIASPNDGLVAMVDTWDLGGNVNQRWRIVDHGDGTVEIHCARNDLTLDVAGADPGSGAKVIAWKTNGQPNQRFRLEAT